MNMDIVGGKWKQFRGRLRHGLGRLTGSPFGEFEGQQDILNGKIQEHRGRSRSGPRRTASVIPFRL